MNTKVVLWWKPTSRNIDGGNAAFVKLCFAAISMIAEQVYMGRFYHILTAEQTRIQASSNRASIWSPTRNVSCVVAGRMSCVLPSSLERSATTQFDCMQCDLIICSGLVWNDINHDHDTATNTNALTFRASDFTN